MSLNTNGYVIESFAGEFYIDSIQDLFLVSFNKLFNEQSILDFSYLSRISSYNNLIFDGLIGVGT